MVECQTDTCALPEGTRKLTWSAKIREVVIFYKNLGAFAVQCRLTGWRSRALNVGFWPRRLHAGISPASWSFWCWNSSQMYIEEHCALNRSTIFSRCCHKDLNLAPSLLVNAWAIQQSSFYTRSWDILSPLRLWDVPSTYLVTIPQVSQSFNLLKTKFISLNIIYSIK